MDRALAPAELTVTQADGNVHFGDVLQLQHAGSNAVLAVDVHDSVRNCSKLLCPMQDLAPRTKSLLWNT